MKTILATVLVSAALVAPALADCIKVDDENSPVAILSGRITTPHRKVARGSELKAVPGFYLRLDAPLQADFGLGCQDWREIPILDNDGLARLNKHHVIITGELGRFGSALADPPIFISAKNVKDEH
jgi:hypothetical protein